MPAVPYLAVPYVSDTASHVVSGAEAAASYVVYFGRNKRSYTLAGGEQATPLDDPMLLFDVRCEVEASGGAVYLGKKVQFVTLTGARGREWLRFLGEGVQTAFGGAQLRGLIPVRYGFGVLLMSGGWTAGEELRVRWTYAPW